jgi:DNA-binding HxlR family transcriptional regulator
MSRCEPQHFAVDCPSWPFLNQIADKWSMKVLLALDAGPMRFNAIRRHLEGVTQKALTQCLRRLEQNGLVSRRVIPVSPIAVEYEISPLGRTLREPIMALCEWTLRHIDEVDEARRAFQARSPAIHEKAPLAATRQRVGSNRPI